MIVYYKDANGLTMRMDPNNKPIAIILTDDDKFNVHHMSPDNSIYCAYPDDLDPDDVKAWLKFIKASEAGRFKTDDWACPKCRVGFASQDLNTSGLECPHCNTKVVDPGTLL